MLLNTVLRCKKFTRQLTGCLLTVEDSDMVDSVQVIQEQRRCSNLADSSHSDCQQSYSDSSAQSQTPRQLIPVSLLTADGQSQTPTCVSNCQSLISVPVSHYLTYM